MEGLGHGLWPRNALPGLHWLLPALTSMNESKEGFGSLKTRLDMGCIVLRLTRGLAAKAPGLLWPTTAKPRTEPALALPKLLLDLALPLASPTALAPLGAATEQRPNRDDCRVAKKRQGRGAGQTCSALPHM